MPPSLYHDFTLNGIGEIFHLLIDSWEADCEFTKVTMDLLTDT